MAPGVHCLAKDADRVRFAFPGAEPHLSAPAAAKPGDADPEPGPSKRRVFHVIYRRLGAGSLFRCYLQEIYNETLAKRFWGTRETEDLRGVFRLAPVGAPDNEQPGTANLYSPRTTQDNVPREYGDFTGDDSVGESLGDTLANRASSRYHRAECGLTGGRDGNSQIHHRTRHS